MTYGHGSSVPATVRGQGEAAMNCTDTKTQSERTETMARISDLNPRLHAGQAPSIYSPCLGLQFGDDTPKGQGAPNGGVKCYNLNKHTCSLCIECEMEVILLILSRSTGGM